MNYKHDHVTLELSYEVVFLLTELHYSKYNIAYCVHVLVDSSPADKHVLFETIQCSYWNVPKHEHA